MVTAFSFTSSHTRQQWEAAWRLLQDEQPLLQTSLASNTQSLVLDQSHKATSTFQWASVDDSCLLQDAIDDCLASRNFDRIRLAVLSCADSERVLWSNPHALVDAPTVLTLMTRLYHLLSVGRPPLVHRAVPSVPPSIYRVLGVHPDNTDLPMWLSKATQVRRYLMGQH